MLIKLTLANRKEFLYVNPDQIGHCYRVPQETEYSKVIAEHTRLGITTHNNGGFEIVETPEQIIKLIQKP
jgi:hypothetical protein